MSIISPIAQSFKNCNENLVKTYINSLLLLHPNMMLVVILFLVAIIELIIGGETMFFYAWHFAAHYEQHGFKMVALNHNVWEYLNRS